MAATMDVLLVEDDPRIARVVERALTDVGHRVEVARDGLEGLTSAASRGHATLSIVNPDRCLPSRQLLRQQLDTGKLGEAVLVRSHRWSPLGVCSWISPS